MYIKKYTQELLKLIKYANRDKELELEIRVKDNITNITNGIFNNILKRLMGYKNVYKHEENEMLDITFDNSDIRVTIFGSENINLYCLTNDIRNIDSKYLEIIKKNKVQNVDVREYKIRFNLKRENNIDIHDKEYNSLVKKWMYLDKIFRYKKRITYKTKYNLFNFDMTIVKSSSKKTIRTDNKIWKKKFIKSYMKKYIVKPDYVVDLNTWFNDLDDEADVEMMGKLINVPIFFKTLQKSNVLTNTCEYEVELEYVGNKIPAKNRIVSDDKKLLILMMANIIIILQSIQQSYYIISEDDKKQVIDEYKEIIKDYKFQGPMNVTLEKRHIIERNYEDYPNTISIRKGYSVTEKADGERNLLIILKNGDVYLMNRKNTIKSLGANIKELAGSIFDCEYIIKDKHKNNINFIMLFDIYFLNNEDLRQRILYRSQEEQREDKILKSRYELLSELINIFDTKLVLSKGNNLKIFKKRFYFGDDDTFDPKLLTEINKYENDILEIKKTDSNYLNNPDYIQLQQNIDTIKNDSSIFKECKKVYEKEYPYEIDGLVFTPRSLFVGEEPERTKKNMFDGRWYRCFKWKPPELNTIDFLVKIKKDPSDTHKDLIKYINVDGNIVAYKTLLLYVGYNPAIHTKHNSFRILNENLMFDEEYSPTLFNPTSPYIKDVHLAFVEVKNDNIYTNDDNNIINDNDIIECSYDLSTSSIFKWNTLRVRDNFKPNDFVTATNVWNSINNPISLDMVLNSNASIDYDDNYYNRIIKRTSRKCNSMYDFHSYVKKNLIIKNLGGNKCLLDLCVGKGADLNHWIDAEANFIVGIDISHDNLTNSNNGACNRILNKSLESGTSKYAENSLMIWGDVSKNISNMGNDELNQYYLDIVYNNIEKELITNSKLRTIYDIGGLFDCVSCQFAIHYLFENSIKLNNYIKNVSDSLKPGGKFIGTYLDGKMIFDELKETNTIQNHDEILCWKITKKYTQSVFNDDDSCLNYEIDIYNESIGKSIKEYLVNSDYLNTICDKYNLQLVENKSFKDIYKEIEDDVKYGDMTKMNDELKKYSFLNNYFIYQKY